MLLNSFLTAAQPTYLWMWNIIAACDHQPHLWRTAPCTMTIAESFFTTNTLPTLSTDDYAHLQPGDIIFLPNFLLPTFITTIFPSLKVPFILVTTWNDSGIRYIWYPSNCLYLPRWVEFDYTVIKNFIADKKLIHWFAHNYDLADHEDKITILPLGLDYHKPHCLFHEVSPHEQEKILEKIVQQARPTHERLPLIYADFHLSDTLAGYNPALVKRCGYSRTSLHKQLAEKPFIKFLDKKITRKELWEEKSKYAFSISPHGNGLDCHRTWEDLILGCIIIVKTSTLDPLYKDLPVVIVQDWTEITEENLAHWLKQYSDAFTNPIYREKLTSAYWINLMKKKQHEWRNKNTKC